MSRMSPKLIFSGRAAAAMPYNPADLTDREAATAWGESRPCAHNEQRVSHPPPSPPAEAVPARLSAPSPTVRRWDRSLLRSNSADRAGGRADPRGHHHRAADLVEQRDLRIGDRGVDHGHCGNQNLWRHLQGDAVGVCALTIAPRFTIPHVVSVPFMLFWFGLQKRMLMTLLQNQPANRSSRNHPQTAS
jgi:hypothetical protein